MMGRFVRAVLAMVPACAVLATGTILAQEESTFETATRLFQNREYAAAADKCEEILLVHPDYPWGWHCIGVSRWKLGELNEAEDALRRAVALQPESFESRYVLGRVLSDRKEYRDSAGELEQAAAAATGSQQERAAVSAQADAWFRAEENEKARSLLETLVAAEPAAFRPRYMLGLTCRRTNDLACALEHLRAARDLKPDERALPRKVAELSAHAAANGTPRPDGVARFDEAIDDAEVWVTAGTDGSKAGVHLVDLLLRAGRYDAAARRSEALVSEYPDACRLPVLAAKAWNRLGDSKAARGWSDRALECDPDSAEAWNERARADLDEARALIASGELLDREDRIDDLLAGTSEALAASLRLDGDGVAMRVTKEAASVEAAYRGALARQRADAAVDDEIRCDELRVKWWSFQRDTGPPVSAEEHSFLRDTCGEDV